MTKIINAKKKISRKLKVNLWGSQKDPFLKRNYKPGEHGPTSRSRPTDYGNQLRAKQILRSYYAIKEKQFRSIFKESSNKKGDTGKNFINLLEKRLDVAIYRSGFVNTIYAAKQFISHNHVTVNGNVVNVSSYRLKVGDVVGVIERMKESVIILDAIKNRKAENTPYLETNEENRTVKLVNEPDFSDVPYPVDIELNLVIEYYSR
jgi:small subunit ribosomal protein S4